MWAVMGLDKSHVEVNQELCSVNTYVTRIPLLDWEALSEFFNSKQNSVDLLQEK